MCDVLRAIEAAPTDRAGTDDGAAITQSCRHDARADLEIESTALVKHLLSRMEEGRTESEGH